MDFSEVRLVEMLLGWSLAFYGVLRRDWTGTATAIAGMSLCAGAMFAGEPRAVAPVRSAK